MEDELSEFEEIEIDKELSKDEKKEGVRPDFRIVQPVTDREGKTTYVRVGAIWKNTSKSGNDFYVIKIGNLKLLAFKNER
jgi:uncharacterized protein (DUF736 family)